MISALSGGRNSANMVALFARQPNQFNDRPSDTTKVAQNPTTQPPSSGGQGYSAQALLSSILGALTGDGDGTATGSTGQSTAKDSQPSDDLSKMLTRLMDAVDTNGDGTLSADEVKAATDKVAKAFGGDGPASQSPASQSPVSQSPASGTVPNSLYQSVFESMVAQNGQTYPATLSNDLAQKFMATLQATA